MALHPAVTDRLARLAPDQQAAATAPPGPVLCVAPAGSGKTTTLVARIAWLVATGVSPDRITAVTFNKRAADELGERLAVALEPLGIAGRRTAAGANVSRARTRDPDRCRRERGEPGRSRDGVARRSTAAARWARPRLRRFDDGFSRLKLDEALDVEAARARLGAGRPAKRAPTCCVGSSPTSRG